jgi:hypothetical protein
MQESKALRGGAGKREVDGLCVYGSPSEDWEFLLQWGELVLVMGHICGKHLHKNYDTPAAIS